MLAKLALRPRNRLEDKYDVDELLIETIAAEAKRSLKWKMTLQRGAENHKSVSLRAAEAED